MSDHEAQATGFHCVPDCCKSTTSTPRNDVSANTFVCALGSYRASLVALESSSLTGEIQKASLWLDPQIYFQLVSTGVPSRAVLVLHSWSTMPMKHHSSGTFVGGINYLTAAVLSGFAQIPVSSNRCPRNLILISDNSHFCGLRAAPPYWILSNAASKLMSCSAWVLPKISLSSMWHTTPFDPVRILFILSWKCSGALDILKGGWSP